MTMAGMIVLTLMAKLVAPEDLSLPVPPVGSLQVRSWDLCVWGARAV